jgi:hypothetical protein
VICRVGALKSAKPRSSEGPPPTPPETGLIAWHIADTGTFQDTALTIPAGNGDTVLGWEDQSPAGNHLIQSGGNGPVVTDGAINARPALTFVVGEYFDYSTPIVETESTFFVVFKNANPGGSVTLVTLNEPNPFLYHAPTSTFLAIFDSQINNTAVDNTVFVITAGAYNSGTVLLAINDETPDTVANSANVFSIESLGNYLETNFDIQGDLAEVMIYDTYLSEEDRNTVIAYLNYKYDVF